MLFQDSYFDNHSFNPQTTGISWCCAINIFAVMSYRSFGERSDHHNLWVHRSTSLRWTFSTKGGGRPRADKHCSKSIMYAPKFQIQTHLLVIRVSHNSLKPNGWPMFNNLEFSSNFWNIPKKPRTHSPGLRLLLLLEINNFHLPFLNASAQRIHCFMSRKAVFGEKLNSALLPICNSLLRQASMNSLSSG